MLSKLFGRRKVVKPDEFLRVRVGDRANFPAYVIKAQSDEWGVCGDYVPFFLYGTVTVVPEEPIYYGDPMAGQVTFKPDPIEEQLAFRKPEKATAVEAYFAGLRPEGAQVFVRDLFLVDHVWSW